MSNFNSFILAGKELYENYGGRAFFVLNPTENVHLNAFKFPLSYVAGLCLNLDCYVEMDASQTIYALTLNEMIDTNPLLWDFVVYCEADKCKISDMFISWANKARIGVVVIKDVGGYELILNHGDDDADREDK